MILEGVVTLLIGFVLYLTWARLRRSQLVAHIHRKHVFITGCDTGFGRELALKLDRRGVPVWAGCLTQGGAADIQELSSGKLQTVIIDVTKTESVRAAYDHIRCRLPTENDFWGVVNNAGVVGPGGPVEFNSRLDYEKIFSVNFYGIIDVINRFLPLLKKSGGRIVNISSMAGFTAWPNNPVYTASKFAVYGWTEALRKEKEPWGISVSMLCPGFFRTGLASVKRIVEEKSEQWERLPAEIREEYGDCYRKQNEDSEALQEIVDNFSNPDLNIVVSAYEHALFSRYPRDRYLCGGDARFFSVLHVLPSWATDLILKVTTPKGPSPALKTGKALAG